MTDMSQFFVEPGAEETKDVFKDIPLSQVDHKLKVDNELIDRLARHRGGVFAPAPQLKGLYGRIRLESDKRVANIYRRDDETVHIDMICTRY